LPLLSRAAFLPVRLENTDAQEVEMIWSEVVMQEVGYEANGPSYELACSTCARLEGFLLRAAGEDFVLVSVKRATPQPEEGWRECDFCDYTEEVSDG
jgi:hypothetical protein